jgi:hypothetical protein
MPFCTQCGSKQPEKARFCGACGAELHTLRGGVPVQTGKVEAAQDRKCPFCRQAVHPKASRCPHCAAEIGLLEQCIPCHSCRELVVPTNMIATNEKGSGTDLAKLVLGGQYFLSSTEESYLACPVCKTPVSYCSQCQRVTIATVERKWVGLGRSKSGYQYTTRCSGCRSRSNS